MSTPGTVTPKRWTASELRKLPQAERDAVLAAAAALAEQEYRNNPELTAPDTLDQGHCQHKAN